MASSHIIRVTMFKIPKENVQKALGLYKTLSASATKDGKPYILSLVAGPSYEDARNQGYTLVAKSEFKSMEDMVYYDNDCEAHKTLKAGMKTCEPEGIMTVFYTPSVVASI